MFIKRGDGQFVSLVNSDSVTEDQKKLVKDLKEELKKDSVKSDLDSIVDSKSDLETN